MSGKNLSSLFAPESVAVVGASSDPEKVSARPLRFLREYGYGGRIYPVNPHYDRLGELTCYPDVAALPEVPDVALISVKGELVESVITQCADVGIPNAVIFPSLFSETGREECQERILTIARRSGMRILGPNSQGLVNFSRGIPLTFSYALKKKYFSEGHIACISQSSAFGFSTFAIAADRGVNFRYVVTTGDSLDIDVVDVGMHMISDPEVRLLVFYLEGLPDGRRFLQLVEAAGRRSLPIAVLKAGFSSAVRARAAWRHNAVAPGDRRIWDSAARQFGIVTLEDLEDVVDLGRVFGAPQRPGGNRVGILSTSGGAGMVVTDRCSDAGLSIPELSEETRANIEECLPVCGSSMNPVDLTSEVIERPEIFGRCLDVMMNCEEVDMVMAVVSVLSPEVGRIIAGDIVEAFRKMTKPVACCWLIDQESGKEVLDMLRREGVPLFQSPRRCADALSSLCHILPRECPPAMCTPRGNPVLSSAPEQLTEYDASELIRSYDIPVAKQRLCISMEEVLEAGEEIGYPVVLKVLSPNIVHKKAARAIALNLTTPEELRNAYGRILVRAHISAPEAEISGVLVQEMIEGGLECMIGVKRDPLFGPVIAVGLGGIYYEILKDISLRIAPVSSDMALEMVGELKGYPLLGGARGRQALDFRALAAAVEKVSVLACSEPELQELDINPVFVLQDGIVAADAYAFRR